MAKFTGRHKVDDDFTGMDGVYDKFLFNPRDLNSRDIVHGGEGAATDLLRFTAAGNISANDLANVTGIERVRLSDQGNNIHLSAELPESMTTSIMKVIGGDGDDQIDGRLVGSAHGLWIDGRVGDDLLFGGDGSDLMFDGAGKDHIDGGGGDDLFLLEADGFQSGETIRGGDGVDTIRATGGLDLASGQVSGVESISIDARPHNSEPVGALTLGMLSSQIVDLAMVEFTGDRYGELLFTIRVDDQHLDLTHVTISSEHSPIHVEIVGSELNDSILESLDVNATTRGGIGDDLICGTGKIFGDAGDDAVHYAGDAVKLDGGGGYDTILAPIGDNPNAVYDFNLSRTNREGPDDLTSVEKFESLDWSGGQSRVLVVGSTDANVLVGGTGADYLNGGDGDDVLDGGVFSNGATDQMIGGHGDDSFRWSGREFAHDIVHDFVSAEDHLSFGASQFHITGSALDMLVHASSPRAEIGGADVILYSGLLHSTSDVHNFLASAHGATVDGGLFVVGDVGGGNAVLYHALDASQTHSSNIILVCQLNDVRPDNLIIGDFQLVG